MSGIFDKETPEKQSQEEKAPSSLNTEESDLGYSRDNEFEIELEPLIEAPGEPAEGLTDIEGEQLSTAGNPVEDEELVLFEDELDIRGKIEAILFATPAPIKAYSPISHPQIMVAFAPILAPLRTIVFRN